jgi:RING finger and CHY zinc finger domain-containing protein 1
MAQVQISPNYITQQDSLRKRIRDIQSDNGVGPCEKARLIQNMMMNGVNHQQLCGFTSGSNLDRGCKHYEKNCSQFYFECCQVIDPCHRCHLARGNCDHRPARISSIVCNNCNTRQAPGQDCQICGTRLGRSFCDICKIWTTADIYHCHDCGICRVGKAEEMFHCHRCDACFGIESRQSHRCAKVQLKDAHCPLCLESVHTAQKPSSVLSCGHVLHVDCWKASAQKGEFRCPTCRKSLFVMTELWNRIRLSIQLQPISSSMLPPMQPGDVVESPYGRFLLHAKKMVVDTNDLNPSNDQILWEGELESWKLADGSHARAILAEDVLIKKKYSKIYCYDCEKKSETEFHFLGLECKHCQGYNTCHA